MNNNVNDSFNKEELFKKIKEIIQQHKVVLFMKGEKEMPACGFSANAVEMLKRLNVDFETINILSNNEIRLAVKEFSNWPTYPQLYVNGTLVGGHDIMLDMYESGELSDLFNKN